MRVTRQRALQQTHQHAASTLAVGARYCRNPSQRAPRPHGSALKAGPGMPFDSVMPESFPAWLSGSRRPFGCVVSKMDIHKNQALRGYVAMLVVDKTYRGMGVGTYTYDTAAPIQPLSLAVHRISTTRRCIRMCPRQVAEHVDAL